MHRTSRLALIHVVFLLSGVAGLGYQMAFVRMFTVGLGHELPSVLAVVGAFFGGLALGAWTLDGLIRRSGRPGYWVVGLELAVGLWGLSCVWWVGPANELAIQVMGSQPGPLRQWLVSLGTPLVVLLPGTMAMGATLPAMERFVSPMSASGRCVGGLYAVNTFGAVLGTLAGAFFLIPALGYRESVMILAGVDIACAAMLWPYAVRTPPAATCSVGGPRGEEVEPRFRGRWHAMLFATGFLGIGYEIVGLRVLAQVIENTVYSYAAALSVFLIGTAGGGAAYQRWGGGGDRERSLGYLLAATAAGCLVGSFGLKHAPGAYQACRLALGDGVWSVMGSETAVAAMVFLGPTLAMGATFSHLVESVKGRSGGVGRAVAMNTLGGALAPLIVGVAAIPALGTKWALASVSLAYLALIPKPGLVRWPALALPLLILMLMPGDLRFVRTFEGQRVERYREGMMASVAVIENAAGDRFLRVNNRFQMGGTSAASARMELRQGHVPLLLHPEPERALFLGVGTGITALAAADHAGIQVDAVELLPEIVAVLPSFKLEGEGLVDAANVNLFVSDARRFVRATADRYDVVIADLFHPARDGGGMLYTREHFEAIRDRISGGGLFCQWLPLYQLDEPTLKLIIRTFLAVFPDARAVIHDVELNYPALGLIGYRDGQPGYASDWRERWGVDSRLSEAMAKVGLINAESLFGLLVADAESLKEYAGAGAINTDNRPLVVYRAPHFAARRGVTSYGRLLALLGAIDSSRASWGGGDPAFEARIRQWVVRRDQAIHRAVANQAE